MSNGCACLSNSVTKFSNWVTQIKTANSKQVNRYFLKFQILCKLFVLYFRDKLPKSYDVQIIQIRDRHNLGSVTFQKYTFYFNTNNSW